MDSWGLRGTEAPGFLQVTPPACSQGLAAPSFAVLGPRGVALLVPACLFLSHGLRGAGLPAAKSSSFHKNIQSLHAEAYFHTPVLKEVEKRGSVWKVQTTACKAARTVQ